MPPPTLKSFQGQFRTTKTGALRRDRNLQALLQQLRFLSRSDAFESITACKALAAAALVRLKEAYARSRGKFGEDVNSKAKYLGHDNIQLVERERLGLTKGFTATTFVRVKDGGVPGFVLENKAAKKGGKARAALEQIEYGAAAHTVSLRRARNFLFGAWTGSGPEGMIRTDDGQKKLTMEVPKRKGRHFIDATFQVLERAAQTQAEKAELKLQRILDSQQTISKADVTVPAVSVSPAQVSSAESPRNRRKSVAQHAKIVKSARVDFMRAFVNRTNPKI